MCLWQKVFTGICGLGFSDTLIDYAIESNKHSEPYMYTVLPGVLELTGHPARSFKTVIRLFRRNRTKPIKNALIKTTDPLGTQYKRKTE